MNQRPKIKSQNYKTLCRKHRWKMEKHRGKMFKTLDLTMISWKEDQKPRLEKKKKKPINWTT